MNTATRFGVRVHLFLFGSMNFWQILLDWNTWARLDSGWTVYQSSIERVCV